MSLFGSVIGVNAEENLDTKELAASRADEINKSMDTGTAMRIMNRL